MPGTTRRKERAMKNTLTTEELRHQEAEPAPPTELIYRDPSGGFARTPPAGRLDGWEARNVPAGLWANYEGACHDANDQARRAEKAAKYRDELRERLLREWGDA